MNESEKAIIYARYSAHSQRDVSIEQQIKVCREYAARLGIDIVGVYEDHALSGTSDRRPEFQRMILDAEKKQWQYVIIYQLDRFARNRYDSAVYKRQLKAHGVRVLSAMENISDDPTGVLMESLLEGLAEYYSKELSLKIRRGMMYNAENCLITNGQLPIGYKRGSDGRYEVEEAEASIVQEIFDRVEAKDTFANIADDLNARGIKTKRGGTWNKGSFHRLLKNERYTGVYIYAEKRIEGGIPAIIDPDQFRRVNQMLLNKPNPQKSVKRSRHAEYLLTGKIYCGHCGEHMTGVSGRGKSGNPFYYYMCKGRRDKTGCKKEHLRRDDIETDVVEAIRDYVMNDNVLDWIAEKTIEYQTEAQTGIEVDSLYANLSKTREAIKNLVSAIEAGIITDSTRARLLELESEKSRLEYLIEEKTKSTQTITKQDVLAWFETFRMGDTNNQEYRQLLIDAFLSAVYVYDDKMRIIFSGPGGNSEAEIKLKDVEGFVQSPPSSTNFCTHKHKAKIYAINGLFVLCCKPRRTKIRRN